METIIVYDASGSDSSSVDAIQKHIEENNLPEKLVIAASADLLFTLIEQSPQLALVIITQSLNTTPYRDVADAQREQVIAQLQKVPHEIVNGTDVLTPTVRAKLQQ